MASDPFRSSPLAGDSRTLTPPHGTPAGSERRRATRIRVRGRLPASFTTASVPIVIRNISLGGVLIESPEPFPIGVVHHLRMTTLHDVPDPPDLAAQSVYSHSVLLPDGTTTFLTGFEFMGPDVEAQRFVFELVDQRS